MDSGKWAPMELIGRILLLLFALFCGVNSPLMSSYQCEHGVGMKRVNSILSLQKSSPAYHWLMCLFQKNPQWVGARGRGRGSVAGKGMPTIKQGIGQTCFMPRTLHSSDFIGKILNA